MKVSWPSGWNDSVFQICLMDAVSDSNSSLRKQEPTACRVEWRVEWRAGDLAARADNERGLRAASS